MTPLRRKKEGHWEQEARKIAEDHAKAVLFIRKCDSMGKPEIARLHNILYKGKGMNDTELKKMEEWWKKLEESGTARMDEGVKRLAIEKERREYKNAMTKWKRLEEFLTLHQTEHLDEKTKMLITDKLHKECKNAMIHMAGGRPPYAPFDIIVDEDKVLLALSLLVPLSVIYLVLFVSCLTGSFTGKPTTLLQALSIPLLLIISSWVLFVFLAFVPAVLLVFLFGYWKLLRIKKKAFEAMKALS